MKLLKTLLLVTLLFCLTACGSGEPSVYNAPKGAPYEGLSEIDGMNSSNSYTCFNNESTFKVMIEWKTDNENIDHAEFTDEYFLEWTSDEMFPYELCESGIDMSSLKNNKNVIKPGESIEVYFDFDTYYDGIPTGFYKFIKICDVYYKDGTIEQQVAVFSFDLSE